MEKNELYASYWVAASASRFFLKFSSLSSSGLSSLQDKSFLLSSIFS